MSLALPAGTARDGLLLGDESLVRNRLSRDKISVGREQ